MYQIELLLGVGVLITWISEGFGAYIKYYSNIIGRQITGITLVQSIGVLSRIGYFLQAFAIAWILDKNLYSNDRFFIVIYSEIVILLGLIILYRYGLIFARLIYAIHSSLKIIDKMNVEHLKIEKITLKRPKFIQVFAYIFLYLGAFFPLYLQILFSDFAARSIAISGIINGVSTLILISYIDVKYANQVERNGVSVLQEELIAARFIALIVLIVTQSIIYLIIK
jgi:hypothetical protein